MENIELADHELAASMQCLETLDLGGINHNSISLGDWVQPDTYARGTFVIACLGSTHY